MEHEMHGKTEPGNTMRYVCIGLVAAIIAAIAAFVAMRAATMLSEESDAEPLPYVEFVAAPQRGSGEYPDGTYTTIGIYAPHGVETELEVTITLESDTVVASDINLNSQSRLSIDITKSFEEGYKEFVIGKPIQGLMVGKVARSSLTPEGYNMALRTIEAFADTL